MRYLFGPVDSSFVSDELAEFRESGQCLTFNDKGHTGGADVRIGLNTPWSEVESQWPRGWQPDVIFLALAYTPVPRCVWSRNLPTIGLMADWNILWHERRRYFPWCDLLFTDRAGVGMVKRAGGPEAEFAYLYGLSPQVPVTPPDTFRDLDIVFAGNLHPDIQRERLPWLHRLAQLSDRWRIRLASHLPKPEYYRLLRRAKIVFNRSMRGEANARVAEAVASGALLIQERENGEVNDLLTPECDYATYGVNDLEERLEYFLSHDQERLQYCHAAQAKLETLRWSYHWKGIIQRMEGRLPELRVHVQNRQKLAIEESTIVHDVPGHYALDLLHSSEGAGATKEELTAWRKLGLCRGLGLEQPLPLHAFPLGFSAFRMAWEQAAWRSGESRKDELRAKLQLIEAEAWLHLSKHTSSPSCLYEALARHRDCPEAHRRLGLLHWKAGEPELALVHLQKAHQAFPFDPQTAWALAENLFELHSPTQQARLQLSQRRLAQASPTILEREPWLFPDTPHESALTSIIILCCGQVHLTRDCVDSIRRNTMTPYELVMIDNGSTDGTVEYLAMLEVELGADKVTIIRNQSNQGFAAGCNQGIAAARGRFMVLLNNDTVPQAGWLERLLRCLVSQWPKLGAAGPMSNAAPPPQQVFLSGEDRRDLEKYTQSRRASHRGIAQAVPRLSGFCLAMTREAVRAVGPLDESFGLGFFEDDDYCFRLRDAGYELALVEDAFVFHHGSQTFQGLHLDHRKLLQENFERFREKWGAERTAGYRVCSLEAEACTEISEVPDSTIPATAQDKVADVALTMIVRNEERHIEACLGPVQHLFREIVVVDTGSSDGTKALAQRYATRMVDFPWVDSFSAARNEALRAVSAPWIFWLDADDRVDQANQAKLLQLFASLASIPSSLLAFSMKCVCSSSKGPPTVVDHVRLFRRHPAILWEYRVHEQILPSIRRLNGRVAFANHIAIHHVGYQDPSLRSLKLNRDLRLLRLEQAERPEDPFTLFNLGAICLEQGNHQEALGHLEGSLKRSHPHDSIVRKLHAMIIQAYRGLGKSREALDTCGRARLHYADDVEILFHESLVRRELGDLHGARACLEKLLVPRTDNHFASVDVSLTGYKAYHNLAVICQELGDASRAEEAWRAAIVASPDYLEAQVGLAELFFHQKRWQEFQAVLEGLSATPEGSRYADELRKRSQSIRGRTF